MLGDLFEGCLYLDPMIQTADVLVRSPQPVPACKGVVLFADADEQCISMLTAANIRRTVASRLFGATPDQVSKRGSIAPIVRTIFYQCCFNDFATALKYRQVARVLWPQSWQSMMSLPRPWFVRIDMSAEWPNFAVTEKPAYSEGRHVFGPFPARRFAANYITALRTAFALCHRPDLVDSPHKASTCPYLQMGSCPAPCVGRISRQEYHRQLEKAVAVAGGEPGRCVQELRRQMMAFAVDRKFEQAAAVKKRMEALDLLAGRDYSWTHDLSQLAILHIDRWVKVLPPGARQKLQSYAPYLIINGRIHCLDPFTPDHTEPVCEAAAAVLQAHGKENVSDDVNDNLAIAAAFLYRRDPPGVWMDCSAKRGQYHMPNADEIDRRLKDRFERKVAQRG